MACSCCAYCFEWCARFCCPSLTDEGKRSYPNIQYSLVADSQNPQKEVAERRRGGYEPVHVDETAHQRPPRPKMRFTLMQDGSQFSLHPQMGVSFGENWSVTDQPSPDRFLQRFCLTEVAESFRFPVVDAGDAGHTSDAAVTRPQSAPPQWRSSLPVYREKSLRVVPQNGADKVTAADPVIQFSLHYDIHQSKLRIELQHALNLPKTYSRSRSVHRCDPFVLLHLEPDRDDTLQSEIVKNSHDPKFDQLFQFGGLSVDNVKLQTLVFRLYNHHLNNRAIGRACLPLRDVDLYGVIVQMKITDSEDMEVCIAHYNV